MTDEVTDVVQPTDPTPPTIVEPGPTQAPQESVTPSGEGKTVEQVAQEVLAGQWGRGQRRRALLEAAGFNPDQVNQEVNDIINNA